MWNQRDVTGWETQPRTVRKVAEASVRCQATVEVKLDHGVSGVSTLMLRLDDLTKRRRLHMEEGGSARWAYFERFGERRLWNAVDERLARKAVKPIAFT